MSEGGGRGCGFTAARLSWVRQRGGGDRDGVGSGDVILQRAASVGSRRARAAARAIGVLAIKCAMAASRTVGSLTVREQSVNEGWYEAFTGERAAVEQV